jgi:hypothetical protein
LAPNRAAVVHVPRAAPLHEACGTHTPGSDDHLSRAASSASSTRYATSRRMSFRVGLPLESTTAEAAKACGLCRKLLSVLRPQHSPPGPRAHPHHRRDPGQCEQNSEHQAGQQCVHKRSVCHREYGSKKRRLPSSCFAWIPPIRRSRRNRAANRSARDHVRINPRSTGCAALRYGKRAVSSARRALKPHC